MNQFAAHSLKAAAMVAKAGDQFDSRPTGSWFDSMSTGSSSVTGNVYLEPNLSAVNADIVDTWLQPNCVEVVGDTCYLGS